MDQKCVWVNDNAGVKLLTTFVYQIESCRQASVFLLPAQNSDIFC